jgi:hypothetical protein
VRTASAILVLLILLKLFFDPPPWTQGAPTALSVLYVLALVTYVVLALALWRGWPLAALIAIAVCGGAAQFLWLAAYSMLDILGSVGPSGYIHFGFTTILPAALHTLLIVVLIRGLLSNQRLERP